PVLRRVHRQDADPAQEGPARLGTAVLGRRGVHRAGADLANLGVLVLFHVRRPPLRSLTMLETSRRTVLACAGAACAATLAGCSTYNSNSGGVDAPQGTQSTESSSAPAAAGSGGGSSGGGAAVLAKTSDVPVGGGTILTDKKIVITQP